MKPAITRHARSRAHGISPAMRERLTRIMWHAAARSPQAAPKLAAMLRQRHQLTQADAALTRNQCLGDDAARRNEAGMGALFDRLEAGTAGIAELDALHCWLGVAQHWLIARKKRGERVKEGMWCLYLGRKALDKVALRWEATGAAIPQADEAEDVRCARRLLNDMLPAASPLELGRAMTANEKHRARKLASQEAQASNSENRADPATLPTIQ